MHATAAPTDAAASLPYAAMTDAYHCAFARELRHLIEQLPIHPGDTVVDVACGDGIYSRWLVECVGRDGRVVALDLSCGWLQAADHDQAAPVGAVQAHAGQIPFADNTIDLAWCAQSFRSLADVPGVLREMVRVVRPGGVVAVLENDTLHHMLFPWNAPLELAVRAAEFEAIRDRPAHQRGYYIGRRLVGLLGDAGLVDIVDHAASFVRQTPLDDDTRTYFDLYLSSLERRASPHLASEQRAELHELLHGSATSWLDSPEFSAVCLERLVWGRKPQ